MTANWCDFAKAVPVEQAEQRLPRLPGIYAFHVDKPSALPPAFADELVCRANPKLLYIGKAEVSLHDRVWFEECQHRRPGTFFRSVGVMVGYTSPRGGRNFEFAPSDKSAVIRWIRQNLHVSWTTAVDPRSIGTVEKNLIAELTPLLNIQGNPRKLVELERLRLLSRLGSEG